MLESLYTGASGVKSYTKAMTVVGSDIANVNTVGYKQSRVGFEDILASNLRGSSTKIGKGVNIGSITTIHTQGTFENTELVTDLAINGDGFFVVKDQFDRNLYTRAGAFQFDKEGYLTNKKGLQLQMYDVDPITFGNVGVPKNVQILGKIDAPVPTGNGIIKGSGVVISANLDANTEPPEVPFNSKNVKSSMYNFSTAVSVYDALGVEHTVTIAFAKIPNQPPQTDPNTGQPIPGTAIKNQWKWYALIPGEEVNGGVPGNIEAVGGGFLQFSDDGRLIGDLPGVLQAPQAQIGPDGQPIPVQESPILQPLAKDPNIPRTQVVFNFLESPNLKVGFDFGTGFNPLGEADGRTGLDGVTQFAANSEVVKLEADGNSAGTLENINIKPDGLVEGLFTSGTSKPLARISLAKFPAIEELQKKGDNLFSETILSGDVIMGSAGDSGLGTIQAMALEKSNVDLSDEFVRMIEDQRGFQASAKTITTSDEMLSDIITMKR